MHNLFTESNFSIDLFSDNFFNNIDKQNHGITSVRVELLDNDGFFLLDNDGVQLLDNQ